MNFVIKTESDCENIVCTYIVTNLKVGNKYYFVDHLKLIVKITLKIYVLFTMIYLYFFLERNTNFL